ncbi:hypothetical protein DFJ73DRAFT_830564, partial [Zopfochytrium polystomum]
MTLEERAQEMTLLLASVQGGGGAGGARRTGPLGLPPHAGGIGEADFQRQRWSHQYQQHQQQYQQQQYPQQYPGQQYLGQQYPGGGVPLHQHSQPMLVGGGAAAGAAAEAMDRNPEPRIMQLIWTCMGIAVAVQVASNVVLQLLVPAPVSVAPLATGPETADVFKVHLLSTYVLLALYLGVVTPTLLWMLRNVNDAVRWEEGVVRVRSSFLDGFAPKRKSLFCLSSMQSVSLMHLVFFVFNFNFNFNFN